MTTEKHFLDLQPRIWKEIYKIYIDNIGLVSSPSELKTLIVPKLLEFGIADTSADSISDILLTSFSSIDASIFIETDPSQPEATLSVQDIKFLKEKLVDEESDDIRRLLTTFLIYARANPHPSFWIKYDKKFIFFLASLQKLRVSDQILLTNRLHNVYNLDMQVVGSNQPIPCFKILWQADQPPVDSPDNSLVLLGPLNPATIKSFVAQLPKKEAARNV